ncbi:glycosyltransferase family 2 protein [Rhodococcus spelaei]|uniref:Glycosyltransferase family 2 protein n=1 Tax=Rhodococcus spelaei TaxID=2546320 RepID=A0A541BNU2_9NOCA|nr:glycosyltransferase family 2 protein [Rhodococcus spelaei]TQF73950.1 glycosyltransferase family 2 protein [Rhodococcus spelaei]
MSEPEPALARHRANPTVSVVICCYTPQRWTQLTAAIESVGQQTLPASEVLVVVDHCPALTEMVRRNHPNVRTLENVGPQGLSGARNSGVAASGGDIVAFLDDDAVAACDWLEVLVAAYTDDRVLGVGGHVEPAWQSGRPDWFPHEFDWVVGCSHPGQPSVPAAVRNFIGANMSFRRLELAEIGGFRTDLGRIGTRPLGCEETELCLRLAARRPDGILRHQPAATVHHHVPSARGTWTYFRQRCFAEGLSKAVVARSCGPHRALAAERPYMVQILPRGFARALVARIDGTDPAGMRRAAALLAGLIITCGGYATGRMRRPHAATLAGHLRTAR